MSRLRSDDKLRRDIFELIHARDQRGAYESRSDHVTAILDAVDRHLTQAGAGSEPAREALTKIAHMRCDGPSSPDHCPVCIARMIIGMLAPSATPPQAGHRAPGDDLTSEAIAVLREASDFFGGASTLVEMKKRQLAVVQRWDASTGHRGTPGDGKRCVISDECINEKDCYATGRCLRVAPLPPGSAATPTTEEPSDRFCERCPRPDRCVASNACLGLVASAPRGSAAPDCWCVASMPVHPDCPRHGIAAYADRPAPPGSAIAGAPAMPTPTTYARSMAHKAQDKWLNGPGGHHAALVAVEEVVNVVIERCAKAVEKGLSAGTGGLHVENDTALALASRRIRALGAAPAAPPDSAATPAVVTKPGPLLGGCPRCAHLRAMLPPGATVECSACGTARADAPPVAAPDSAATPTKCRVCHLPCVNPVECAKADRCLAGRGSLIAPNSAAKGPTDE